MQCKTCILVKLYIREWNKQDDLTKNRKKIETQQQTAVRKNGCNPGPVRDANDAPESHQVRDLTENNENH